MISNKKSIIYPLLTVVCSLPLCWYLSNQPFSYAHTYFPHLERWKESVREKNWPRAYVLERTLASEDTHVYKSLYYPDSVKMEVQKLDATPNKTIDQYLELAKKYMYLEQADNAKKAIDAAIKLDPIREDLRTIRNDIK